MNHLGIKNWLLAAALSLPVVVFMAGYLFNHSPELVPTGFIQYDNVAYIAYAKQIAEAPNLQLMYANPFGENGAQIYFQPQTLFFAMLLKLGVPPGWILIPFTLICCVICFRLLIALYDHLAPSTKYRILNIWLLAWGGGLLVVAGIAAHFYLQRPGPAFNDLFIVDPEGGWWGLNFGRSLFFSCEAYYHALFLGCILNLLKGKWGAGLLLMLLLSLSHPFTGIELLGIICTWCVVEFLFNKKEIPLWFIIGALLILGFHIYYYLFYLNQFADHQSVSEQYALNWRLRFYRMIPAYCLVGSLAIASIYIKSFRSFFLLRSNRLLACWFIIAFLLANHEIFMKPMQPVHFTRGYIWTSLFLTGIPALIQLTTYLKTKWGVAGLIVLAVVLFCDNFFWISKNAGKKVQRSFSTYTFPDYIKKNEKEVLKVIDEESSNLTILISTDPTIGYLSTVYSKAIPWYSHPFTTPFAEKKRKSLEKFKKDGILDSAWMNRDVIFILGKNDSLSNSPTWKTMSGHEWKKIVNLDRYFVFKGPFQKKS